MPAAAAQPVRYEYLRDDAHRRVRVTLRVPLDPSDYVAIIDRQASEGAWTFGLLYDLRFVQEPTASADNDQISERVRTHMAVLGKRGPVAIVTREVAVIARSQSYAAHVTRGYDVEVFWDVDEAEDWLRQRAG